MSDESNLVEALDALKPHEPTLPLTLFIFRDRFDALNSGFRFDGVHPTRQDFIAYWPPLGEMPLRGRCFQTVVDLYGRLPSEIEHLLRYRQRMFGERAIWIEA